MTEFGQKFTHRIEIKPSQNKGYIVECGCGTFTFQNTNTMLRAIKDFLKDPKGVEQQYNEATGNTVSEVPERERAIRAVPAAPSERGQASGSCEQFNSLDAPTEG